MDFARFRHKTAALWALGVLALAAVIAGGCAQPDTEERARFVTVTGFVQDTAGNPVPGAQVTIEPVANYFGSTGPFVTNARGQFFIDAVQGASGVQFRLRVDRDGFVSGFASQRVGQAAPTSIITVDDIGPNGQAIGLVGDINAVLAPVGAVAVIGSAGGTVVAPVSSNDVPAANLGQVRVIFPAGAVSAPTTVSVTAVSDGALVAQPALLAGSAAAPAPNTTVTTAGPAIAVNLQPDGATFPVGAQPTVQLPLPFTLAEMPVGTSVPIRRFNTATFQWDVVTTATVVNIGGQPYAEFTVAGFSDWYAAVQVRFVGGTATVIGAEEFPPVASLPDGYIVNTLSTLRESLDFTGVSPEVEAFLISTFGALIQDRPNKLETVVVPAGDQFGVRCTGRSYPVTATVTLPSGQTITASGTRVEWDCQTVVLPVVEDIPAHLQGHVQGDGVGG